jgi:glycerol uptake facilitator-like aquaporin
VTRRLAAEAIGTAFLLIAVVGSGIMGDRLSGGNVAIALLANSLATGAALFAIILVGGPISGAHLNPAVSIAEWACGRLPRGLVPGYVMAQVIGGLLGVAIAHAMFDLPLVQVSVHARDGWALWVAEAVATFGLLAVVLSDPRRPLTVTAAAVGLYIMGAYWFTASTSFANPAVTIARAVTDTFAGIAPHSVIGFIGAQAVGAVLAVVAFRR